MHLRTIIGLAIAVSTGALTGCAQEVLTTERDYDAGRRPEPDDEPASDDEDTPVATRDAGKPATRDSGAQGARDASVPTVKPDADVPPDTEVPPDEEVPPDTEVPPDEEPEPTESVIAGSAVAAKCSTYGKRMGDYCAGVYCGVTEAQIEAEKPAGATCNNTAEQICNGRMTTTTASCTRMIKSDPFNALDDEATLRTKIRDCIYKDASIKANATSACTDCFLDAALCSSKHCVTQCLTGDSAECDKCRMTNNCTRPVFACAGQPDPF